MSNKDIIKQNDMSRREFIAKTGVAAAGTVLAGSLPGYADEKAKVCKGAKDKMIWASLLHLSYNMWEDRDDVPYVDPSLPGAKVAIDIFEERRYRKALHFDESLWNDILPAMQKAGMNMVVLDLGDGVKYESHPEIAVKNAWSVKKLKNELSKMRKLGLEPIPKMNFSAGHDTWLKQYSRMVSTDIYYGVCKDLISEVCGHFDNPRFFHIGMDEETAGQQRTYKYSVVRQNGLWWDDLYFFIDQVERNNARTWAFSDRCVEDLENFTKKMPKSVIQSSWYYGKDFNRNIVKDYGILEEYGYDQIPCGGNHETPLNFAMTADYCKNVIAPSRLLGFLHAPWRATVEKFRDRHLSAPQEAKDAIEKFNL